MSTLKGDGGGGGGLKCITLFIGLLACVIYRGPARGGGGGGGSHVACLNFKMSRVSVLSVLHVAVGNLMKIVCPCWNLRLGTTVQDVENRSGAEVLYHLRPTHAYLVT